MSGRQVTRRGFVGRLAGAAAFGAGGASAADGDGFKIGVCDWTIKKLADPGSFALAKKIGLYGVQVDFGRPGEGTDGLPLFDAALQKQMLAASKAQGVEIASLAMGVLNGEPYKGNGPAAGWVERSLEVAVAMDVKVVLLAFFGKGDLEGDAAGRAKVVERLKRLMPEAEKAGVVYGIESWLHADVLVEMLDAVGSKNLQVYYDTGNMHKAGEDIYAAIPKLGRARICEFHAKDYADLYGKGTIDFPKVREAMDAIGYRGWIVMEGVKMPLGVEESNRYDADYLRTVFPRTL